MGKKNCEKCNGICMSDELEKLKEDELEKLKEKMLRKNIEKVQNSEELPSMEITPKNESEAEALRQKGDKGAAKIVSNIMKQPEVQHVIRVEINKQMFISGLFMAFFLVGFFQLFNVAKVVFSYNWTVDLVIGVIMCIMGATYTVMQIRKK